MNKWTVEGRIKTTDGGQFFSLVDNAGQVSGVSVYKVPPPHNLLKLLLAVLVGLAFGVVGSCGPNTTGPTGPQGVQGPPGLPGAAAPTPTPTPTKTPSPTPTPAPKCKGLKECEHEHTSRVLLCGPGLNIGSCWIVVASRPR